MQVYLHRCRLIILVVYVVGTRRTFRTGCFSLSPGGYSRLLLRLWSSRLLRLLNTTGGGHRDRAGTFTPSKQTRCSTTGSVGSRHGHTHGSHGLMLLMLLVLLMLLMLLLGCGCSIQTGITARSAGAILLRRWSLRTLKTAEKTSPSGLIQCCCHQS